MEIIRRPRFRRSPDIAPMQITPRDEAILRQVHRHRFLRSSHVRALVGGSAQQVLRRLHCLYHHGFLERPRAQIAYYHEGGPRVMAYGLGYRGVALLRPQDSLPFQHADWSARSREIRQPFLQHALLTADFMVGMELSCRDNLWLEFVPAHELGLRESVSNRRRPLAFTVMGRGEDSTTVVPDAVFGLRRRNVVDRHKDTIFFVEADRGTMPVTRRNHRQTSFFRKLLAYQKAWHQGVMAARFGESRFRVLTITSTARRRAHLMEACRALPSGRGLFLFTDKETLAATRHTLLLPWFDAQGGIETLA